MPENTSSPAVSPAIEFGGITPILRVASLDASLAYYVDVLGFSVQWRNGGFASVRRGRASLMLSEGDQGHPGTWVWLGVSDADALHEELRGRGAVIRHPPTNVRPRPAPMQGLSGQERTRVGQAVGRVTAPG